MTPEQFEKIAEQVHQAWADEKVRQGFADHAYHPVTTVNPFVDRCGIHGCLMPNDASKHHDDMLPYADLAENIREYDRAAVRAVLAGIEAAGLTIVNTDRFRHMGHAVGLLNSMVLSGEQHSETRRSVPADKERARRVSDGRERNRIRERRNDSR